MNKQSNLRDIALRTGMLLSIVCSFGSLPANGESHTEMQLKLSERIVLGTEQTGISEPERIANLEMRIFGAQQPGTTQSRLIAIGRYLKTHRDQFAGGKTVATQPQMDSGETNSSALNVIPEQMAVAQSWTSMYMDEANRAYNDGDLDRAAGTYQTVLTFSPGHVSAYYNLGVTNQQRAEHAYRDEQYDRAGWFSRRARENFQDGLYYCPDDPGCQKGLAVCNGLIIKADNAQNEIALQQFRERQQKAICCRIARDAGDDYKSHRYSAAIRKLTCLVKSFGRENDSSVHYGLARSYRAVGSLDQAMKHASRAFNLDPSINAYLQLLSDIAEECKRRRGVR